MRDMQAARADCARRGRAGGRQGGLEEARGRLGIMVSRGELIDARAEAELAGQVRHWTWVGEGVRERNRSRMQSRLLRPIGLWAW